MRTGQRLDQMEAGLPPQEAILLWLSNAHEHGSLVAYCAWLAERPLSEAPLVHLRGQVLHWVRTTMRGQPLEEVMAAEDDALRDTAFLVELVLVIESETDQAVREGGLCFGLRTWQMRALAAAKGSADRWTDWHAAVTGLWLDLNARERAIRRLETCYLDGHVSLFPEELRRWRGLLDAVEDLVRVGGTVAPIDHPPEPSDEQVAAEEQRLVEWSQARALDLLDQPLAASDIVGRWFRQVTADR